MAAAGNANLVDGRWTGALGGGRFELREPSPPWGEIGSWPSSGPADAEAAIEGCAGAVGAWGRVAFGERRERVIAAARALERDEELGARIARRLGLRPAEIQGHRGGLVSGLGELERPVAGDRASVSLCAPCWSDLVEGALRTVAGELVAGSSVVLVSDPRLPMVADHVASALLDAGVPAGTVAVVHGLTRDGLKQAIREPRVRAVVAGGDRDRIAWLRRTCEATGVPRQELERPRSAAFEVGADDDVADAARRVAAGAFGRAATLFGQRRGQIGRVFCDEACFSRFTASLLATLEEGEAVRDPLPLIDRHAVTAMRRRRELGLDEGATLLLGGEPFGEGAGGGASDRRYLPVVFTNVEERMTLVREVDPMPVLCLLRSRERTGAGL